MTSWASREPGEVVAVVLSAAALVVSALAARYTRAQAEEARRSNDWAVRIDWVLAARWDESTAVTTFDLRNIGGASATNVRLVLAFDPNGVQFGQWRWGHVGPGESVTGEIAMTDRERWRVLGAATEVAGVPNRAAISWADPDGRSQRKDGLTFLAID